MNTKIRSIHFIMILSVIVVIIVSCMIGKHSVEQKNLEIEILKKYLNDKKEVNTLSGDKMEKISQQNYDKAITEKKDEDFKRKQECFQYKELLFDKLIKANTNTTKWVIEEIFYSPVENSCIAFYTKIIIGGGGHTYYNISDILSNKTYLILGDKKQSENELKRLKNE